MILQYYLSIYEVNFFSSPTFRNFKIRIINQKNSDCKDSIMLDSKKMDGNVFPVSINIKGGDKMLIKIKMISVGENRIQNIQGEGVLELTKAAMDQNFRFVLFEQKNGKNQMAKCSIDLLLSGHILIKDISKKDKEMPVKDSNSKNVQEGVVQTEEKVFSQMSYTVSSQQEIQQISFEKNNQTKKKQLSQPKQKQESPRKQTQVVFQQDQMEESYLQSERYSFGDRIQIASKSSSEVQSEVKDDAKITFPLDNGAYLSQDSLKKSPMRRNSINKRQLFLKLPSISPSSQKSESIVDSSEPKPSSLQNNLNDSMSPEHIRQKMKQTEKIMDKLRRYLAKNNEQSQPIVEQFSVAKQKDRKKKIKIDQIASQRSKSNFLKYHSTRVRHYNTFKNFRVQKYIPNPNQSLNESQTTVQMPLNKLILKSSNNEKIATFDAQGYRSYCKINKLRGDWMDIEVSEDQQILRIIMQLNDNRIFEGTADNKECQDMVIRILPQDQTSFHSQQLRLHFDIRKDGTSAQYKIPFTLPNNDRSMRGTQEIGRDEDIRTRVQSISLQPWGYGQSYLNDLKGKDIDDVNMKKGAHFKIETLQLKEETAINQKSQQTETIIPESAKNMEDKSVQMDREELQVVQSFKQSKKEDKIQKQKSIADIKQISSIKLNCTPKQKSFIRSDRSEVEKVMSVKHSKKKKKTLPVDTGDQKDYNIPLKRFYTSQNSESQKEPSLSVTSSMRSHQKESSIPEHSVNRKEVSQINRLRNGNRNNIRFKEKEKERENYRQKDKEREREKYRQKDKEREKEKMRQRQKQKEKMKQKERVIMAQRLDKRVNPNIKEMWQKLLIKKKIEEDQMVNNQSRSSQLSSKKYKNTKRNMVYDRIKESQNEEMPSRQIQKPSQLYGCIAGTRQVIKVDDGWANGATKVSGGYPMRKLSLQIKNISLTQSQMIIDEDSEAPQGKFIKLSIKDQVTYFTQIIFNGQFNSILWKLSGCMFRDLEGGERLQIEVYSTLQNKITILGKVSVRVSKLHFLRNNHIYNGKIMNNGVAHGQFTMGFEVEEVFPFQVVREEEETISRDRSYHEHVNGRKSGKISSKFFQRKFDIKLRRQSQGILADSKGREQRREKILNQTLPKSRSISRHTIKEDKIIYPVKIMSQPGILENYVMPQGLQSYK